MKRSAIALRGLRPNPTPFNVATRGLRYRADIPPVIPVPAGAKTKLLLQRQRTILELMPSETLLSIAPTLSILDIESAVTNAALFLPVTDFLVIPTTTFLELMTIDFHLKTGDRLYPVEGTMSRLDANKNVIPIDLSTASSVQFKFVKGKGGSPLPDATAYTRTAAIVSGVLGTVRYDWTADDVAVFSNDPGEYVCEFRAIFPTNIPVTCPNDGYRSFRVLKGI